MICLRLRLFLRRERTTAKKSRYSPVIRGKRLKFFCPLGKNTEYRTGEESVMKIQKRDGRVVPYEEEKIVAAIHKANNLSLIHISEPPRQEARWSLMRKKRL